MRPSATVAINELCNEMIREGRDIYKLGLGQSPFPVPSSVVEKLRTHADRKDYLAVRGLTELRSAVADYHRRRQGLTCSFEDVLVGPGSKELMFLLQLVYYGDLVVPTPSWVSYAPQAAIIGRKIVWVETDRDSGWQITPERLEEICREDPDRPRIVVLNYPNNPTGGTYKLEELKGLADVARRHRVILLSDEIYGELHFRGQHVSVARFYPEGTIVSGGLSKWCGAGGWRLGVFVFPPSLRWLLDAMAAVASETFTATSAPIQYAGVRAYYGGLDIERYLWNSRRVLRALGRWCHRTLTAAGLDVVEPRGAFYLFPDFSPLAERLAARGIRTSAQLCASLLQDTGVAILPGSEFGRPRGELTARLAFVNFDGAQALAAAEVLPRDQALDENFLRQACLPTITAIERLADWTRAAV
ncbi:MAG: aminotransferase class I/II-fold pyridoxal phosphate-dependent enzyme [Candidatus Krumholzibacteriia bacterium]